MTIIWQPCPTLFLCDFLISLFLNQTVLLVSGAWMFSLTQVYKQQLLVELFLRALFPCWNSFWYLVANHLNRKQQFRPNMGIFLLHHGQKQFWKRGNLRLVNHFSSFVHIFAWVHHDWNLRNKLTCYLFLNSEKVFAPFLQKNMYPI